MATHTTNYNLEKPEASDPFGDFRQSYNDNLDIIDQNLGGGGGGGGHTIIDPNGSNMAQRAGLQFTGSCSVTDDALNDKTVVNISGGGGSVNYSTSEQVIGTWVDGKPLYQITYSGLSLVCTNANQSYATNTDWGNIKKIVHSDIIDQYGQSCAGSVVYTGTPAKLAVYMQMANRTVTDITIQYTKTTD